MPRRQGEGERQMRATLTRKAGFSLAFTGAVIAAALTLTAPAGAKEKKPRDPSPVNLDVICYDKQGGGDVTEVVWTVYFGYSSTETVTAGAVDQSHVNGPNWTVDPKGAPHDFNFPNGFPNTNGAVVNAFTATNNAHHGDETVSWHVEYEKVFHHEDPAEATFDPGTASDSGRCDKGNDSSDGSGATGDNGSNNGSKGKRQKNRRVRIRIVYFIPQPAREAYCAGANNTVNGEPVRQGSFLNLLAGQPDYDPNYKGATPAIFVEGIGLTCDPPPAGYAFAEMLVNNEGQDLGASDTGRFYAFYKAPPA